MSKSDVQSLTILAVSVGAVVTIEEDKLADKFMPAILWAREAGSGVVDSWPIRGDNDKIVRACFLHCKKLHRDFERAVELYSGICLISLAQLLLTDLQERIKDKAKLEIIEPLSEAIDGIHDLVDPDGDRYEAYAEAERLATIVKGQIEF